MLPNKHDNKCCAVLKARNMQLKTTRDFRREVLAATTLDQCLPKYDSVYSGK